MQRYNNPYRFANYKLYNFFRSSFHRFNVKRVTWTSCAKNHKIVSNGNIWFHFSQESGFTYLNIILVYVYYWKFTSSCESQTESNILFTHFNFTSSIDTMIRLPFAPFLFIYTSLDIENIVLCESSLSNGSETYFRSKWECLVYEKANNTLVIDVGDSPSLFPSERKRERETGRKFDR